MKPGNKQQAAAERARELIALHQGDPAGMLTALNDHLCVVLREAGYDDLVTVLAGAGLSS